MTECRTRYYWAAEWEDPLLARELIPVLEPVVESWLQRKRIFADPLLVADPFGRIVLSITVKTKDRWTNHNRAMYFAAAIAAAAKVRLKQLGEPLFLPLPPHTNRGQGRRGPTGLRRPCKVEGCTKHAKIQRMCQPHYQKWRYWGDPLGGPWLREAGQDGTAGDHGAPVESVRAAHGADPDHG
jgi:hypothetical protein